MKPGLAALKGGSSDVREALAAARSARNRATRAARYADRDAAQTARHHKRRLARKDRELEKALRRRVRVQVSEANRPRGFARTPRKLFIRQAVVACAPLYAPVIARPDGLRAVHYSFTSRGFASTTGRRWRAGEATRAVLYSVRDDALEGGEHGWWSNVAADRNEAAAFARAL